MPLQVKHSIRGAVKPQKSGGPLRLTDAEKECLTAAYELDEDASNAYFDCAEPIIEDLVDCVEDELVCSDPESINSCLTDDVEACPDLPNNVQEAEEDCF